MTAQLIKRNKKTKSTELQPMVQVQVPEGVEPGAKLSVQAANGSMVDIVVPVGALPNTTLQVPMPMPGKKMKLRRLDPKEKKAQHTLYKRRCQCFCAAVFTVLHYRVSDNYVISCWTICKSIGVDSST